MFPVPILTLHSGQNALRLSLKDSSPERNCQRYIFDKKTGTTSSATLFTWFNLRIKFEGHQCLFKIEKQIAQRIITLTCIVSTCLRNCYIEISKNVLPAFTRWAYKWLKLCSITWKESLKIKAKENSER